MNKIFKVVWSKSKECYVVVSEFAKNNSGKKKIVVAGIFAALAMTNANVALAVNDVPASTGNATVALGTGTITGTNAVGLGKNVTATLNDVVVIGTDAKVESAGGGVAIGQNAYSKARYANTPSVAVGKKFNCKWWYCGCSWYWCDGKRSWCFIFTRYCHWWWCITGARGGCCRGPSHCYWW